MPPLAKPLHLFAAWLKRTRRAGDLCDFAPDFQRFVDIPQHVHHTDIFTKTEPWERRAFMFDAWEASAPAYARAAQHAADLYVSSLYRTVYFLRRLARSRARGGERLFGASAELGALYHAFYGEDPPYAAKASTWRRSLTNAGVAAMIAAHALFWCAARIRLRRPPTQWIR